MTFIEFGGHVGNKHQDARGHGDHKGRGRGHTNSTSNDEDSLGAGIVLVAAVAISIGLFAKHSFEIYLYIKWAACLSAAPFVIACALVLFKGTARKADLLGACVGVTLGGATFLLAMQSHNSLDLQVVQRSHRLGWRDFWATFSRHEQQPIIQNFLAALLLAIGCLFNFSMGIFVAWRAATQTDIGSSKVLYRLRAFSPRISSFFLVILLAVAWALMTGRAFHLLKAFQMNLL